MNGARARMVRCREDADHDGLIGNGTSVANEVCGHGSPRAIVLSRDDASAPVVDPATPLSSHSHPDAMGGKPVGNAQAVAKSIEAASAAESISFKVVNSKGERRDVIVPVPKKAPILPGPK